MKKASMLLALLLISFICVAFSACTSDKDDNKPPVVVTDEWVPGLTGEEVAFSVEAHDPDGEIVLYEWDFDGDGNIDWSSSTTGNTTWTFRDYEYRAILRVKDNDGAITEVEVEVSLMDRMPVPNPELYIDFPENGAFVNGTINVTGHVIAYRTIENFEYIVVVSIENDTNESKWTPIIFKNNGDYYWFLHFNTTWLENGDYHIVAELDFEGFYIVEEIEITIENE